MAIDWSVLADTSDTDPPIVVIYGGGGLGKTTLASEFPSPLYVRTSEGERAPTGVSMKSFGVADFYADVVDQIDWMLEGDHDRKTFVLDALDGLEQLIRAEACARHGWKDIEEPGFGRGYAKELEIWREFIVKVSKLKKAGYYTVLICHNTVKTDPGVTTDSYPRWRLNLRPDSASAIFDSADLVGFIHQRVSIAKEDAGFNKKNTRGEGSGEILIAVKERPGYVAKNRYDIDKHVLPFKKGEGFTVLNQYFPAPAGV